MKKRTDPVFENFRQGTGTDVELVDVRMHQSLSIYVACPSRKSVDQLDNSYESGNLLADLRETFGNIDIKSVQWDDVDFNRCIQYFHNLSGKAHFSP